MSEKRRPYVMEEKIDDVIFGYKDVPSCGWFGHDDGGFGIFIYPDGELIYRRYIFDDQIKKEKTYKISLTAVKKIEDIISSYEDKLANYDDKLDNGSCDGDGNIFILLGNEYVIWNIEHHDIDDFKKNNPKKYKQYLPVMKQENMMLSIFNKVRMVLLAHGVILGLYFVKVIRKGR